MGSVSYASLIDLMGCSTGSLTSIIIVAIITFASYLAYKRRKMVWHIEKIPGPKAWPILGNAFDLAVSPQEIMKQLVNDLCDYGTSISRVWLGMNPYVLIFEANAIETILTSQKFIDKSHDYEFLHPWLGTGLLTSTGQKWHARRKMLTPAFHFKILEDFLDVFNEQSDKLMKKFEQKADGKTIDIFRDVSLCTLDIILETAMGTSINAQDQEDSEYVKAVHRAGALVQRRQFRVWLHVDWIFDLFDCGKELKKCIGILHKYSNTTIKERRRNFEEAKLNKEKENEAEEGAEKLGIKKRLAFLDLLLENTEGVHSVSDEDLREEVDTFMFEGSDTTAAAINWSIYLLGGHPEIQKRVVEEVDDIFGDSDRPATSEDLRKMKYLECCIKEALRIFPSVPIISRKLKEDAQISGYTVPAETTVGLVIYRLHRDPKYFPEPDLFDPERFFPENSAARHPYAYVPFSAGPRNCIGQKFALMEEKVVLSSLFRKFRVESPLKREEVIILGELILRPMDGNFVKLFPRH